MYEIFETSDKVILKKAKGFLSPEESQEIFKTLTRMNINVTTDIIKNFACSEEESYLDLPKGDISVYVTPDEMEAYVKIRSEAGLDFQKLLEACSKAGVVFGICEQAIRENLNKGSREFLIAVGKAPKDGEDGRLVFHVELPKKCLRGDSSKGKVNMYDLDIFRFVKAGQVIAEVVPPKPGENGITVTGKVLRARDGNKAVFSLGEGVALEGNYIKAIQDGVLKYEDNKIWVDPVLVIPHDVDLSVGNITSDVDVYIQGWVRSGFRVCSKKDIVIEGGVERDAVIEAEGSVSVKGGIFGGPKSRVFCKKDLYAKFIQDTNLEVHGNIYVNEYIMNCTVICHGSLFLSGQKGKLIGSDVTLKYAAYVKELIGGKKHLKITGFSRKELISLLKKLEAEKDRMRSVLVNVSMEIKKSVAKIAELKITGDELSAELKHQRELTEKYKELLNVYAKLEARIGEIKELLTHVKGEGAIYIMSKAEDFNAIFKGVALKISEMGAGVVYIDESNEVRFE